MGDAGTSIVSSYTADVKRLCLSSVGSRGSLEAWSSVFTFEMTGMTSCKIRSRRIPIVASVLQRFFLLPGLVGEVSTIGCLPAFGLLLGIELFSGVPESQLSVRDLVRISGVSHKVRIRSGVTFTLSQIVDFAQVYDSQLTINECYYG